MNTQFIATCYRCGQGINNVCRFQGKSYGPECIFHATGDKELLNHIRLLRHQRSWHLDADTWFKSRDRQINDEKIKQSEQKASQKAIADENDWLIVVLKSELDSCFIKTVDSTNVYSRDMSFIENMASKLSRYYIFAEMSDREKEVLIDIYAKSFGRRNSKAYNKAYDEAYAKAYPDD